MNTNKQTNKLTYLLTYFKPSFIRRLDITQIFIADFIEIIKMYRGGDIQDSF